MSSQNRYSCKISAGNIGQWKKGNMMVD